LIVAISMERLQVGTWANDKKQTSVEDIGKPPVFGSKAGET
jgi:hypothetical protein